MKKLILITILLLSGLIATSPVIAGEEDMINTTTDEERLALADKMIAGEPVTNDKAPCEKFKRGAINIVTSPLEIPKQIKHYYNEGRAKEQRNVVWLFVGAVKGVANTIGRLGSGVWDVATFNMNKPAGYKSLMQPEYVNQ